MGSYAIFLNFWIFEKRKNQYKCVHLMMHAGLLMRAHNIQKSNTPWYTEPGFTVPERILWRQKSSFYTCLTVTKNDASSKTLCTLLRILWNRMVKFLNFQINSPYIYVKALPEDPVFSTRYYLRLKIFLFEW